MILIFTESKIKICKFDFLVFFKKRKARIKLFLGFYEFYKCALCEIVNTLVSTSLKVTKQN